LIRQDLIACEAFWKNAFAPVGEFIVVEEDSWPYRADELLLRKNLRCRFEKRMLLITFIHRLPCIENPTLRLIPIITSQIIYKLGISNKKLKTACA